ncbi:Maf family protein [Congregibacter sp.]|uniref:Maf family protein n=1 Tax=Congregibacter sp. TaxID=2744308 RepID=UPI003F6BA248
MDSSSRSVVLGSASPRRADLLAQLGVSFIVRSADIDETPSPGEAPRGYVQRMAQQKAAALAGDAKSILLTADTTVVLDDRSLGKPRDATDARLMLEALSGRTHDVFTAVCACLGSRSETVLIQTAVEFTSLTARLIDQYLATDEPWDKAGAYAIQGLAGSFVRRIDGSVSNVIGLPLVETRELLLRFGLEPVLRSRAP